MFFFPLFGFLPGATVHVDPRDIREHCELIAEAAGLSSLEKLAHALDIDEGQFHRQINGEGHVSLTRIVAKLGTTKEGKPDLKFYRRYAWLLACRFGVPPEARRSAHMVIASLGRRRQLKMSARQSRQRRSA